MMLGLSLGMSDMVCRQNRGIPIGPVVPILTWVSPPTDRSADFTVAWPTPHLGDIIHIEISETADFQNAYFGMSLPWPANDLDDGECEVNDVGPLQLGTLYARCRGSRAGGYSLWSNTEILTITG